MLRQTFLNALFTGVAQAISLIVIVVLASVLEAERFGILSVQLSAAALVSIISTFQFERVYVRVKTRALKQYIAFHLRCLFFIAILLFIVSLPFKIGPSSVMLGTVIGLSQIALYAAARQGKFSRIWLMKGVQAASLLLLSGTAYLFKQDSLYWLAFLGSYFCSGLMVLDRATRTALRNFSLRADVRRFGYSVKIAAVALGSLLTTSFAREFPVLLSGAMGQPETAGSIGLVMRLVGAPVGLLARSASAVVASYVAFEKFNTAEIKRLLVVPMLATFYIVIVIMGTSLTQVLDKYVNFTLYLIALAPYFIVQAYIGLLGSAIVFYRLQRHEFFCSIATAFTALVVGGGVYFGITDMTMLLWFTSGTATLLGAYMMNLLIQELRQGQNSGD